jgi:hypothetical protein
MDSQLDVSQADPSVCSFVMNRRHGIFRYNDRTTVPEKACLFVNVPKDSLKRK